MKNVITIDVAALFEKLDPKYKHIGILPSGSMFAFRDKPEIEGIGFASYGTHGKDWTHVHGLEAPQLFERPVPSVWKGIATCSLPANTSILWRLAVSHSRAEPSMPMVDSVRHVKSYHPDIAVEWCEIPT